MLPEPVNRMKCQTPTFHPFGEVRKEFMFNAMVDAIISASLYRPFVSPNVPPSVEVVCTLFDL